MTISTGDGNDSRDQKYSPRVAALLTAAFGLVAALAWNGAIQAIFKQVFGTADSITAQPATP